MSIVLCIYDDSVSSPIIMCMTLWQELNIKMEVVYSLKEPTIIGRIQLILTDTKIEDNNY